MSEKPSVPLKRELHLELENMSLKLHILKRNAAEAENKFRAAVEQVFIAEEKKQEDWLLDLDRGLFVRKEVKEDSDTKSKRKSS